MYNQSEELKGENMQSIIINREKCNKPKESKAGEESKGEVQSITQEGIKRKKCNQWEELT